MPLQRLRMRRTWRKRLCFLGLLGLLLAALGVAAVAGWLPPVNRWVEQRLLAELRILGVETDATHLRELSWRRAVAGPAELHLPGLALRVEEARAELGWAVLAGHAAPQVVLKGVVVEVALDRLEELRRALQPQDGGFPYGRVTIEESRVVLHKGSRELVLPFTGFIDSRVEEMRAGLAVAAPALSGRLDLRTDLGEGLVELDLHEARIELAQWRQLLVDFIPPELLALDAAPDAAMRISGTAAVVAGRLQSAKVEADLPALVWKPQGQQADLAAVKLGLVAEPLGHWRVEARTAAFAWQQGEQAAGITDLDFSMEPRLAQLRFGSGRVVAAGMEFLMRGRAQARWGEAIAAATGEANLTIEKAGGSGMGLAAPCELVVRWNGSDLGLAAPVLALTLPQPVQAQALEATVSGLRTGHPVMVARVVVGAEVASPAMGLSMQPAEVSAQLSLSAGLTRGEEGARVEWSVPQQRRLFCWDGGTAEAAIGGEGVVDLDRNHFSGRAAIELRALSANGADWYTAAQTATFTLRWPRLWLDSLRGWSGLPAARLARELAWAGDYDLNVAGGQGRIGASLRIGGVELRATSKGAQLFETGGADLGASAADVSYGGMRLHEAKVQGTFGLEGGVVQGGIAMAEQGPQPVFAQTLHWGEGLGAEGTFGFEPAVLSGDEPWSQWLPALAGVRLSGGIGFRGHSSYAQGVWSAGADVLLRDFTVAWPEKTITLEKIDATLVLTDLFGLHTAPAQQLTMGRADLAGVELKNSAVEFSLGGPGRMQVAKLETEAFGGRLTADAFEVDPRQPEMTTQLHVAGAELGQLLRLFDNVPAEAQGLVDGTLPLTWKDGQLHFGTGFFGLAEGELGRVEFTRDLHLLTSGRSPNSIGFSALLNVEKSIQKLHFNRLRIDIYPTNQPGQSLRLRLEGTPVGGALGTPVSLDVNVNAPLEHFLNWGRSLGVSGVAAH